MHETVSPKPSLPRTILAGIMVAMGVLHFTHGETFASVMPDYLPWHLPLVYLSGVIEIALGLGLLSERTRSLAAWGLIALFIAVFPANINMALNPDMPIAGLPPDLPHPPAIALWLRLPLQFVLIWWAAQYRKPGPSSQLRSA